MNRCLKVIIRWNGQRVKVKGSYLEHLRTQRVLIKIGLGQTFKGIFTTIFNRGGRRGNVVEVESADRGEIFGLGWVARQDLTDLVDDSIASGTEGPDNLKLDRGKVEIVVAVAVAGRDREKLDSFTVERKTLTDNITWEENVLHWSRMSGGGSGLVGRSVGACDVESRRNRTRWRTTSGIRLTTAGGRPRGRSDGRGKIDGEHEVCSHRVTIGGTATRAIGGLFEGQRLRILGAEREVRSGHRILQHC